MQCPYCHTENREDRDECYFCDKDISMLRLLTNKARLHFNNALEHADRQRYEDAASELQNALDLDGSFTRAAVVLGTVHAKMERSERAREAWRGAIASDTHLAKAQEYLDKLDAIVEDRPARKWLRRSMAASIILAILVALLFAANLVTPAEWRQLSAAAGDLAKSDFKAGSEKLATLAGPASEDIKRGDRAERTAAAMAIVLRDGLEARLEKLREAIARGDDGVVRREMLRLDRLSLPEWAESQVAGLREEWSDHIALEVNRLDASVNNLRTGREADKVRRRLEKLADIADDLAVKSRAQRAARDAQEAKANLPYEIAAEAALERETSLLDFSRALADARWSEAEARLAFLLEALPAAERPVVASLAEAAWAAKLAETGQIDSAPELEIIRERFPELSFDPSRLLIAGGEPEEAPSEEQTPEEVVSEDETLDETASTEEPAPSEETPEAQPETGETVEDGESSEAALEEAAPNEELSPDSEAPEDAPVEEDAEN